MDSLTPRSVQSQISPSSDRITYQQFATLARQCGSTTEFLAKRFRGKFEHLGEFFYRLMGGNYPDDVIPFRSVVASTKSTLQQNNC